MKRFNLLVTRTSYKKNVDHFQRIFAQGGQLVFENVANFICREAYLPMKIPENLMKVAGPVFY